MRCLLLSTIKKLFFIIGIGFFAIQIILAAPASDSSSSSDAKTSAKNTLRIETGDKLITLKANNKDFSAIYRPAEAKSSKGCFVLLPGSVQAPTEQAVIQPLRLMFTKHKWATLSFQLPEPTNASDKQAQEKNQQAFNDHLKSVLHYLTDEKIKFIILIAYDRSVENAIRFIEQSDTKQVKGLVMISGLPSLSSTEPAKKDSNQNNNQKTDTKTSGNTVTIFQTKLPIFDIYASDDYLNVIEEAQKRQLAFIQSGRKHYRQEVIYGADHSYFNYEATLVQKIKGWLKKSAKHF